MTFRSRKLLNLAHGMHCTADFAHDCREYEGCVPAHSDSQLFGRGVGHKSSDWAFAAVCQPAHLEFDRMAREEKQAAWLRAFVKTQEWLWSQELVKVA